MTDEPTLAQFEEATLTLENDRTFYDGFLHCYREGSSQDAGMVRVYIHKALLRLALPGYSREYRETLRLYFEDRYNLRAKPRNQMEPYPGLFKKASQPTTAKIATPTSTQSFPEYKAMTTSILTLTTKHYINGTDIASPVQQPDLQPDRPAGSGHQGLGSHRQQAQFVDQGNR